MQIPRKILYFYVYQNAFTEKSSMYSLQLSNIEKLFLYTLERSFW